MGLSRYYPNRTAFYLKRIPSERSSVTGVEPTFREMDTDRAVWLFSPDVSDKKKKRPSSSYSRRPTIYMYSRRSTVARPFSYGPTHFIFWSFIEFKIFIQNHWIENGNNSSYKYAWKNCEVCNTTFLKYKNKWPSRIIFILKMFNSNENQIFAVF